MAVNKYFYLDEAGLGQYDTLIKQYIGSSDYCKILYGTTSYWNNQSQLVSELDTAYVYTDYYTDGSGNYVPAVKLGDGVAYLIDRPVLTKIQDEHIADQISHITAAERTAWNDKVTCYINSNNPNRLIFTKNSGGS